jgi:hypothetical protein
LNEQEVLDVVRSYLQTAVKHRQRQRWIDARTSQRSVERFLRQQLVQRDESTSVHRSSFAPIGEYRKFMASALAPLARSLGATDVLTIPTRTVGLLSVAAPDHLLVGLQEYLADVEQHVSSHERYSWHRRANRAPVDTVTAYRMQRSGVFNRINRFVIDVERINVSVVVRPGDTRARTTIDVNRRVSARLADNLF